jgi:hypothetical protein
MTIFRQFAISCKKITTWRHCLICTTVFFDGVWLSVDKQARLFVRRVGGEHFTIHLTEVEALNISGLRAGNIIFDVVLIAPEKLTLEGRQAGVRL